MLNKENTMNINIIESLNEFEKDYNPYENTPFEKLLTLTSDDRGKWGEKFLHSNIKLSGLESKWDGDSNTDNEDGSVYDILVNLNRRTEVKTATNGLDKKKKKLTNTWQHENIYKENIWDDLLLLDVNPNGFYLTHIPHSEMCFGKERHIILEKKSTKHLSGWKFDSSRASLTKGLKAGITIYIDVDNDGNISDDDNIKLRRFIVEKFTN